MNWRILHDRRPELVDVCDKLRMKEIARERVDVDRLQVAETLWSGTDPAAIVWPSEREWVLKPNHGSGEVVFGPSVPDDLQALFGDWLASKQADHLGEWGYSQARHLVVLEERIPGPAPDDYKFFCFDGEPRAIQHDTGRFGVHQESFLDMEWNLMAADRQLAGSNPERPALLAEMTEIARMLSQGWDFIRVDLYAVDDQVWFGELSPYPGGGVTPFDPPSFDNWLGHWWQRPVAQAARNEHAGRGTDAEL